MEEIADEFCLDSDYEVQQNHIPQVDGAETIELTNNETRYSFHSDFGKEDIEDTLCELFPNNKAELIFRERVERLSADHLCTVSVQHVGHKFSWPNMKPCDSEVFRNLKIMQ